MCLPIVRRGRFVFVQYGFVKVLLKFSRSSELGSSPDQAGAKKEEKGEEEVGGEPGKGPGKGLVPARSLRLHPLDPASVN